MKRRQIESAAEAIVASIQPPSIPADRTIDLRVDCGFNPCPEGLHDFQPDLQRTIDAVSAEGGGTIVLSHPAGRHNFFKSSVTYRSGGPIELRSRVRLALEPSIQLKFDFNPEAYSNEGQGVLTRYEGTLLYGLSPCIRIFRACDIEIIGLAGRGHTPLIHGDGEKWQRWMWQHEFETEGIDPARRSYERVKTDFNNGAVPLAERRCGDTSQWFLRPDLVQMLFAERVRLEGIELQASPFWVIHPIFSSDLIFRELKFECLCLNNDGIDPESNRRVLIEHVQFNNYDDNIAIKSGRDRDAREGVSVIGSEVEGIDSPWISGGRTRDLSSEIVIRHNTFRGHYALCIGSEVSGGVRAVYALDNHVPQYVTMLVFIKSSRSRGGVVEDVHICDFHGHRIEDAMVCLVPNYDSNSGGAHPPRFRDISISGLNFDTVGRGLIIHGWPDAPVERVRLENISATRITGAVSEFSNVWDISLNKVRIGEAVLDGTVSRMDGDAEAPAQN